jgi:hypothetical protein
MTETLPALGAHPALSDDRGTKVGQIVPFGCNDEPKSHLFGREALETTPPISEIAAARRGRGRPSGPSLRILLTQKFPDGATAEMLVGAGFRSDLTAALKRKDVKAQHGRYLWIAVSRPEQTHATQPQVCSNPLALLPPVTDPDPARVNKEELRTERFRIEEIPLDKIKVRARRRALNQAKVDAIADSMDRMGLQTPITVCKTVNGDFELIVGWHRHAAAKLLNWAKNALPRRSDG